ncbi:MAG: hypothetical protein SGPRY_007700 [Prymnesium sp.]
MLILWCCWVKGVLGQCHGFGGDLLTHFSLGSRRFIGRTSLPAEFSFLMANQAHVGEKSLVLDPFCGTGSTLLSCAKFGARVVGVDIDERTFGLESEEGAPCGVETNFLQVVRIDPNFLARF